MLKTGIMLPRGELMFFFCMHLMKQEGVSYHRHLRYLMSPEEAARKGE
jgi:hypothetical protein